MTPQSKRLLIAALVVVVLGLVAWIWWNVPVRAATRALLRIVDTIQIEGGESSLARHGKAARLKMSIADPVDLKFREAGREGDWSAESLQMRYASAALAATSATVELDDLSAEKTAGGEVRITALLKAKFVGQGATRRDIERRCRWIMKNPEGSWIIASFRELDGEGDGEG